MKMQFSAISQAAILLTTLLSSTHALPTTEVKRTNDCGDSTFENQSSGASPLVSDCQQLVANIAGDGSWSYRPSFKTIATFGTCAFGIAGGFPLPYSIGNEDVRDLITDSITRFQWEGKVGAKGSADGCGDWAIFHT
jgi:hypothetical protein